MPTIWDHDLWSDLYAIDDPEIKTVTIRLYRLILDMHNKDVLAEQIASALKGERKLILSSSQRVVVLLFNALLAADLVTRLFHLHL